jgi:hypothetical protein
VSDREQKELKHSGMDGTFLWPGETVEHQNAANKVDESLDNFELQRYISTELCIMASSRAANDICRTSSKLAIEGMEEHILNFNLSYTKHLKV